MRGRSARARGALARRLGTHRAERGAATMALVLLGAFGALAVVFVYVLPLLSGTEQTSRAQTAADAAALAGAEELWTSMASVSFSRPDEGETEEVDLLRPSERVGAAAATYARKNGAEPRGVTVAADGTVEVRVELDEPGAAGTAPVERRAAARPALAPRCTIVAEAGEPAPTPTRTPQPTGTAGPTPAPTPPPAPPDPPTEYSLSCAPGASGVAAPDIDDETDYGRIQDAVRDFVAALLAAPALKSTLVR